MLILQKHLAWLGRLRDQEIKVDEKASIITREGGRRAK